MKISSQPKLCRTIHRSRTAKTADMLQHIFVLFSGLQFIGPAVEKKNTRLEVTNFI